MSKSLSRLEDLPHYGSFTKSIHAGRGVVFVLGSNSTRRKFSIGKGRREEQKPVYYTSRVLRGVEGRYLQIEKLAFALITISRKLRHYFKAYVINVMTDHPLKKVMNKLEVVGRLIQWAVELSEFDIRYRPRHAIKAQALANFVAEFTPNYDDLDEMENSKKWIVHVDGSSTHHVGGICVVLQSPEGDKLKHKVRL